MQFNLFMNTIIAKTKLLTVEKTISIFLLIRIISWWNSNIISIISN